jgi:hypothetical protein
MPSGTLLPNVPWQTPWREGRERGNAGGGQRLARCGDSPGASWMFRGAVAAVGPTGGAQHMVLNIVTRAWRNLQKQAPSSLQAEWSEWSQLLH